MAGRARRGALKAGAPPGPAPELASPDGRKMGVREGVRVIMRLMAELRWIPGVTPYELSRKIGRSERTVVEWAKQASNRLREERETDDAELRAKWLAGSANSIAVCKERAARAASSKAVMERASAAQHERNAIEYLKLCLLAPRSAAERNDILAQVLQLGREELEKLDRKANGGDAADTKGRPNETTDEPCTGGDRND